MDSFGQARVLLREFKGANYLFGPGVLSHVGDQVANRGERAVLVRSTFHGSNDYVHTIKGSLSNVNVKIVGEIRGPNPNAPHKDLLRLTNKIKLTEPDMLISFGGGSNIDASKAANILYTLGGNISDYFGTGKVSKALEKRNRSLVPHVAIQSASSSAAHLTKYSNITNLSTMQKKLIVDESIIPEGPVFDYVVTFESPPTLTVDGAMDGIAHLVEVLIGATGESYIDKVQEIAKTGISLILEHLPDVLKCPKDIRAREALCLGTDLGGYAIMIGGTNGGHLTSFSLVDILSHGRSCAIMNPYYIVFFAPAVEKQLRLTGKIYKSLGYSRANFDELVGRELGLAVANAMFEYSDEIGLPKSLGEVEGFREAHIERALSAARNPQLKMKLQNMPVPLNTNEVDKYMGSILKAASVGDLNLVKNK